ncbi:hypothetical protein F7R15_22075 [Pseudomonas reinekei]|uniref:Uncharacterized protein n=1 Tax=Pseudomonas reinekei TaxID=395598 RepID=A0A6H9RGH7_PSERE|nr:hypothetical protein F7R15_22075 [Pseudomonas reinekei]
MSKASPDIPQWRDRHLAGCVWEIAIASRLAPTLDLRRSQIPCGSQPAGDGYRSINTKLKPQPPHPPSTPTLQSQ